MAFNAQIAPGKPEPYALQPLCGEIIYIPHSKSAMRLLVTGKESNFALVGTGGSEGEPIGFHYHREAHDVFLCIQGQLNVWAGDQARTLGPGDFASVPPGVVHRYQILGDHTEFVGLIVPGGWEEFFRFIGEPYSGPMWPLVDDRPFHELLSKLKAAAEKFDMVPQPQHPGFDVQPWTKTDLPGSRSPYFLRSGPKYLFGGVVVGLLAGMKESDGKFTIGSIEGSSWNNLSYGFVFPTDHAFYITEGLIEFVVDGENHRFGPGQTVYLPKSSTIKIQFATRFAKAYVFANGAGLVSAFQAAGSKYDFPMIPEKAAIVDENHLRECVESLEGHLVQ